ncbi:methyltransferase domain-containing protein [Mesorhizobium sp. M7A.F.Ca.MR.148.00.0.0]|uniref:class I SAM-dependent methyltransferase n=1 Tax=Mesorhizobium sp. M7A.F.Ca.MR.148.00.0.0 TaxID=2496775 RepID=UPI000FCA2CB6|nr:methyltransferase domain-containing protein [Mesorhizobium sp. M7A.F.Ca.MR.148.00.0.0]RUV36820.1 methyltransferase domain-containing protein [Mesorhizobium sp. M7A.F.Ca.MR.148.00.0.0]
MNEARAAYDNVPGNYYDKYNTRNPIARYLMDGFLSSFDMLTAKTGVRNAYEVGCGEGNLSIRLHDRGWNVRGSDLESVSVSEANEQCTKRGLEPIFETRSLFDLTPEVASAELVICCEVLEHIPDTEQALAILKSLAKPYLLVSVPREPVWRALNMARGKYISSLGNTPGHIQHWSSASFINLLGKSLEVVEVLKPLPWTMALCRCD